jgi:hypothetical protein
MNKFQEQLNLAVSEINKITEKIVSKEDISQLDLDILSEKLRNAYDFILFFSDIDTQLLEQEPVSIKPEEKQEIKEFVKLAVKETLTQELKAFVKEMPKPEIITITKDVKAEVKEQIPPQIQPNNELSEEEKALETIHPSEEFDFKYDDTFEDASLESHMTRDSDLVFEDNTEVNSNQELQKEPIIAKNEEPIIEKKDEETPSVLRYLNEEMPKNQDVSKKLVGERYEQQKSIFDNISTSTKQEDISNRFKNNHIDLRNSIGVNEKFMFINDLFSGNLKEYTDFIQKLNDSESSIKANQMLESITQEKKWVTNSLSYTTLKEIMHKKFD